MSDGRSVAALIDIEQQERTAEARATAEMIQILGHELLNGLAPIASLAESGVTAVGRPVPDLALLREILGTLARRADELQHFTGAYRMLARLPEPTVRSVSVGELVGDLKRLFAEQWPNVSFTVDVPDGPAWPMDREQIGQAVWALLQNAAEAATGCTQAAWVATTVHYAPERLIIDVQDSGPGFTATDVNRAFRPFHTTKPSGSGIGLSLARQIAQGHGGTLTIEPIPTTTLRLALPLPEHIRR